MSGLNLNKLIVLLSILSIILFLAIFNDIDKFYNELVGLIISIMVNSLNILPKLVFDSSSLFTVLVFSSSIFISKTNTILLKINFIYWQKNRFFLKNADNLNGVL